MGVNDKPVADDMTVIVFMGGLLLRELIVIQGLNFDSLYDFNDLFRVPFIILSFIMGRDAFQGQGIKGII